MSGNRRRSNKQATTIVYRQLNLLNLQASKWAPATSSLPQAAAFPAATRRLHHRQRWVQLSQVQRDHQYAIVIRLGPSMMLLTTFYSVAFVGFTIISGTRVSYSGGCDEYVSSGEYFLELTVPNFSCRVRVSDVVAFDLAHAADFG